MNIAQFHTGVFHSFVNLQDAQGKSRSFAFEMISDYCNGGVVIQDMGGDEITLLYSALTEGIVRIDYDWQGYAVASPLPRGYHKTLIEDIALWDQPKRIVVITRDLPPTTIARVEHNHTIIYLSELFDLARLLGAYEVGEIAT